MNHRARPRHASSRRSRRPLLVPVTVTSVLASSRSTATKMGLILGGGIAGRSGRLSCLRRLVERRLELRVASAVFPPCCRFHACCLRRPRERTHAKSAHGNRALTEHYRNSGV